jgi:hypothetical protein
VPPVRCAAGDLIYVSFTDWNLLDRRQRPVNYWQLCGDDHPSAPSNSPALHRDHTSSCSCRIRTRRHIRQLGAAPFYRTAFFLPYVVGTAALLDVVGQPVDQLGIFNKAGQPA